MESGSGRAYRGRCNAGDALSAILLLLVRSCLRVEPSTWSASNKAIVIRQRVIGRLTVMPATTQASNAESRADCMSYSACSLCDELGGNTVTNSELNKRDSPSLGPANHLTRKKTMTISIIVGSQSLIMIRILWMKETPKCRMDQGYIKVKQRMRGR